MDLWGTVIAVFILLVLLSLVRAHLSGKNDVSLLDLVTRNGRLSTTSIMQLVGGVVGTWVVIKFTMSGALSYDIFLVYLGYVASIEGFSKFVSARYSAGDRGYGSPYARRYPPIDSAEDIRPGARKTEPIE